MYQLFADLTRPVHVSCVALNGRAVLIIGKSGSGKSALALQLMAFGAELIADDRTQLHEDREHVLASVPPAIAGRIEARGVGLLRAKHVMHAKVVLVVDLDQTETDRFPISREVAIGSVMLPLIYNVPHAHFAPAILQILRDGRSDP